MSDKIIKSAIVHDESYKDDQIKIKGDFDKYQIKNEL